MALCKVGLCGQCGKRVVLAPTIFSDLECSLFSVARTPTIIILLEPINGGNNHLPNNAKKILKTPGFIVCLFRAQ